MDALQEAYDEKETAAGSKSVTAETLADAEQALTDAE